MRFCVALTAALLPIALTGCSAGSILFPVADATTEATAGSGSTDAAVGTAAAPETSAPGATQESAAPVVDLPAGWAPFALADLGLSIHMPVATEELPADEAILAEMDLDPQDVFVHHVGVDGDTGVIVQVQQFVILSEPVSPRTAVAQATIGLVADTAGELESLGEGDYRGMPYRDLAGDMGELGPTWIRALGVEDGVVLLWTSADGATDEAAEALHGSWLDSLSVA